MYDYVEGIADWMAAGLETEGRLAGRKRAGSVAREHSPTCGLKDTVATARASASRLGFDLCVVTNESGIVLGLLRAEELASPDEARVEDVMRSGPSTFRPHVPIAEMAAYMTEHDLVSTIVTISDGSLLGILFRDDAVRAAHEEHEHD